MLESLWRRVRMKGRKVVVKYKGSAVVRRAGAGRPDVPGAQVACRVVTWAIFGKACFFLSLPRAGGTLRGHQDRLAGQEVEPAVRRAEHPLPPGQLGSLERRKAHASATMSGRSGLDGTQPSSARARADDATSAAGSPGRRGADLTGTAAPGTALPPPITWGLENPVPLPRLRTA